MKKMMLAAAAAAAMVFGGQASASVLTGDTVTLSFEPSVYSQSFVVGDGVDHRIINFAFDLNGGADGNRFTFTSVDGASFGGSTSFTLSGLDFTDGALLERFELVSTSLTNFSFTNTADSVTFFYSDPWTQNGVVLDGFFRTTAVNAVPLPGTLPLLFLGVGALCATARSRRKNG